jgi:hypothetical protein
VIFTDCTAVSSPRGVPFQTDKVPCAFQPSSSDFIQHTVVNSVPKRATDGVTDERRRPAKSCGELIPINCSLILSFQEEHGRKRRHSGYSCGKKYFFRSNALMRTGVSNVGISGRSKPSFVPESHTSLIKPNSLDRETILVHPHDTFVPVAHAPPNDTDETQTDHDPSTLESSVVDPTTANDVANEVRHPTNSELSSPSSENRMPGGLASTLASSNSNHNRKATKHSDLLHNSTFVQGTLAYH